MATQTRNTQTRESIIFYHLSNHGPKFLHTKYPTASVILPSHRISYNLRHRLNQDGIMPHPVCDGTRTDWIRSLVLSAGCLHRALIPY